MANTGLSLVWIQYNSSARLLGSQIDASLQQLAVPRHSHPHVAISDTTPSSVLQFSLQCTSHAQRLGDQQLNHPGRAMSPERSAPCTGAYLDSSPPPPGRPQLEASCLVTAGSAPTRPARFTARQPAAVQTQPSPSEPAVHGPGRKWAHAATARSARAPGRRGLAARNRVASSRIEVAALDLAPTSRAHVRAIAGLTSQHVVELLTSRRRYSRGGDWHVAATATRMRDRRARVRLTFDHFDV